MSDNPTTEAARQPDRKDKVIRAFGTLIEALGDFALYQDFDRGSAFRRKAVDLSVRWHEGRPASTPRGGADKTEG